MTSVRIQQAASRRLDDIFRFTRTHWGQKQAERYLQGLFDSFELIQSHGVVSRPIPAEFGVTGYCYRYQRHVVYWKHLADGDIGIVTILHERMHQIERLRSDFGL